jgi:hypothetical protein
MPDVTVTPTLYITATAPPAPLAGDLWWNSQIGIFFVYYDDGTSAQWVTTQPVKYINLAEIKAPAGGDLTGFYPNPSIKDEVALEFPTLKNPLALSDYSQRLTSSKWVVDKFASFGQLGDITEGPGILLTPNPLAGDSTIALKAIAPPLATGPTYGSASTTAAFTINIYGQITSIANVAIPPINSPAFTGIPTAPTPVLGTDTTQLATTQFVNANINALAGIYAPLANPVFTGNPRAPTPAVTDDDTTIATTAFVNSVVPGKTLRSFGCVGNGIADDFTPLTLAFAAQAANPGLRLDGEGLTYASFNPLVLTAAQTWIQNAEFKDLDPSGAGPSGGGTLRKFISHLGAANATFVFKNVKINRNGNGTEGSLQARALSIEHIDTVRLDDLEVYGDGAGRAVHLEHNERVEIFRPYIHDMTWVRATNPLQELIIGIFMVECNNVLIDGHLIENLRGTVGGVDQFGPVANYRNTDGISFTGVEGCVIQNGFTYAVGEGVDVTGSILNRDVQLINNTYFDCAGHAEKFVHGPYDCSTYGGRYYRTGLVALTVSGGQGGSGTLFSPKNFVAFDCIAYDTAIDGSWAANNTAGFRVDGPGLGPPPADPLVNIWFINCKAYSTFAKYGFLNTGATADQLHVPGFDGQGATVANVSGVTAALSEITSIGRWSFTGGLDIIGSSAFTGAMTVTGAVNVVGSQTINDDLTVGIHASRYVKVNTTGSILDFLEVRRDDNGAAAIQSLRNFGITAAGQGIGVDFRLGTGNVDPGSIAGDFQHLATDTWAAAANRSSKWRLRAMNANNLTASLDVTPISTVLRPDLGPVAGGAAGSGYLFGTTGVGDFWGSGAPTISAPISSTYRRTDGSSGANRIYVNTDGATDWRPIGLDAAFINTAPRTINFAVANTDHEIPIPLPPPYARYCTLRLVLSKPSADLSAGTFGLFTQAGGAGFALVASGTACTLTTAAEDTNGNMQIPAIVNTATRSATSGSLFLRVQNAAAGNCRAVVVFEPVSGP